MSDWKDKVAAVAPFLGKALSAVPVVGPALEAVSEALLGHAGGSEADVAERVANWQPADELALRAAEQKFTSDMAQHAIDLERIAADDRASARTRETATHDWTPRVIALGVCVAFFGLLVSMLYVPVPSANQTVLNIMLGVLGGAVTTVLTYYFGGSASSDVKTAILGRVAEKK